MVSEINFCIGKSLSITYAWGKTDYPQMGMDDILKNN